ncbi:SDR family NAD(P)-dependent oxidoreductase [Nakamurella endophytica]|uniref:Short-chain dehydrogenase n=1 Tax=Nakamurella endophytica TaxID=1748367 RepID=A0A917SSF1_9ACTN|nr:SDR family NAD(P)-dependent oxidoreductase [Nakamurella endophytica]GGL93342.1 short-chain dehydrogenase [Nakamurella endophytica]
MADGAAVGTVPAPFDLSGRVAVVTGAGSPSGIGLATARLLSRLGAAVLVTGTTGRIHDRAAELATAGHDVGAVVADLTGPDGADRVAAAARDRWGRVDVLVNNAGMVSAASPEPEDGPLSEVTPAVWRAGLARNLDTAYLVTRAVLPLLTAPGGRIVLVSSVTGPVMAMRDDPVYAAAKAGLTGLARALAVDLGPRGVTVNAVAPGWIATGSQTADEARQGRHTPLGRSGTADEVAAVIVFLASPGAGYLTGQTVVVDGGNSVAEQRA